MQRSYKFNKVMNFRDLGGYHTERGLTKSGVIFRSARLNEMDEDDLDKFKKLGIKSVLDLRSKEDNTNKPDRTQVLDGVYHYHVAVNGNGRTPIDDNDMGPLYMEMIADPENTKEVIRVILNAPKPLLFHCAVGKDRTGVYANMILEAAGVDIHDRQAHYLESYSHLRQYALDNWEFVKTLPSCLFIPSLTYLEDYNRLFEEAYGSLDQFLIRIGLSEDEITKFKNLLY